jgi:hypothetical protein
MARAQQSRGRSHVDEDEDEDDEDEIETEAEAQRRKLSLRAFADRARRVISAAGDNERFQLVRIVPDTNEEEECSPAEIQAGGRAGTIFRLLKQTKHADSDDLIDMVLAEAVVPESQAARDGGSALVASSYVAGIGRTYESYEGMLALAQGQIKYANDREMELLKTIGDKDKEIAKLNKKLNDAGQKGIGSPETLSMLAPVAIYAIGQLGPAKKHKDMVLREFLDELHATGAGELANRICEHMAQIEQKKASEAAQATQAQAEYHKKQAEAAQSGEENA